MALEGWKVEHVSFQSIRSFVEKHHYSHKVSGLIIQHCFGLFRPRPEFFGIPEMVGSIIYTLPTIQGVRAKYSPDDPDKCLELSRLVCIDDTPKNAESFFISKTLLWLKRNTDTKIVVSYADPMHGHSGIVYKASNFEYCGVTEARKEYIIDGKSYHERAFCKPFVSNKFALARARYDSGDKDVYFNRLKPKHIYTYTLNR